MEKTTNEYLFQMRFLDCRMGSKKPSEPLLEVGVQNALKQSGFDEAMFVARGGIYDWSKKDRLDLDSNKCNSMAELEW